MKDKITVKIKGGYLVATASCDPEYPGIDVEYVADNEDEKNLSRPRVLVEHPEPEDNESFPLRVLIWNDPKSEDYSDEIILKEKMDE